MLLNDTQKELANRIDCSQCRDRRLCDQIRHECPKVNFHSLQVDDISILKPEIIKKAEVIPETGFTKTTRRDFETHMYGNISRCRFKNRVLSFFSSEKGAKGLFFFSHNERYYRSLRDESLPDTVLEQQVMNFLMLMSNHSITGAGCANTRPMTDCSICTRPMNWNSPPVSEILKWKFPRRHRLLSL
jgi:hypothetical protein